MIQKLYTFKKFSWVARKRENRYEAGREMGEGESWKCLENSPEDEERNRETPTYNMGTY